MPAFLRKIMMHATVTLPGVLREAIFQGDPLAQRAYADWLADQGDPRAELYALHAQPRATHEEQRRYTHLRGTVGFLPREVALQVGRILRPVDWDAYTWVHVREELVGLLALEGHPLAREVARGGDDPEAPAILYNAPTRRFVIVRGNGVRGDRGGYPDPVEAAIAALAATTLDVQQNIRFRQNRYLSVSGPTWPPEWAWLPNLRS